MEGTLMREAVSTFLMLITYTAVSFYLIRRESGLAARLDSLTSTVTQMQGRMVDLEKRLRAHESPYRRDDV